MVVEEDTTMAVRMWVHGLFALAVLATAGCGPKNAQPGEADEKKGMDRLAIELRPSKDHYTTSETIDVAVVFRNRASSDLKIPMIESGQKFLFFAFLIVGHKGIVHLNEHWEFWMNPDEKPVRMLLLRPGETHEVTLRNILPFKNFPDLGDYPGQKFRLVAIYSDHS